jgi:VIT1/CCC1 family predicted Fe2+/Mn2+ transporter
MTYDNASNLGGVARAKNHKLDCFSSFLGPFIAALVFISSYFIFRNHLIVKFLKTSCCTASLLQALSFFLTTLRGDFCLPGEVVAMTGLIIVNC